MRAGLTQDEIQAALGDLDDATRLSAATIAALRLVDRLTDVNPSIDTAFYGELRRHFDEGQILALGAALSVASGWQRLIEAFGIRPDGWVEQTPTRRARRSGGADRRRPRARPSPDRGASPPRRYRRRPSR